MTINNYIFVYKNKIMICDLKQILLHDKNMINIIKKLIKRVEQLSNLIFRKYYIYICQELNIYVLYVL